MNIMSSSKLILPLCLISFLFIVSSAIEVSYDGRALKIDGKRRILISGSIHYPRSTPDMWPDLIRKSKEGGLNVIETYVFWNAHEPQRRQYDFSGNLDFIKFIKAVQAQGLYLNLRIGPYVCAEWNSGGLPIWLQNIPGMEMRTANPLFMDEMQNFTTLIVDMVKKEKLFASQGGNIILAQIENEYGNAMSIFGEAGELYLKWCAELAEYLDIGVPWIMCQQPNAPEPIINTCNAFYCDQFEPNRPGIPKMWTENWTGWFKSWGSPDPLRTAEDLAFSVARFYQSGGTFQNYYMYHGGTNFGRTYGGAYITTSYDYNAPLNEYGGLNQPKYGHLKQLHELLYSMEKVLTYGNSTTTYFDDHTSATIYTLEDGTSSCFLANVNDTLDVTVTFQGDTYSVPAWSVSILPNCKKDVYNTARVNTQTSVMVKQSDRDGYGIAPLKWSWRSELTYVHPEDYALSASSWSTEACPVYKNLTWYMTSFEAPIGTDPVVVDLLGMGKGEAWVNGISLGQYWPSYIADSWSCPSNPVCDYRGAYSQPKCRYNCGKPTQRWYHVPRSFLKEGENTLLLWEEMGGDPSIVNFNIVRPGTVCGNAYENHSLELSCEGHPITAVNFASFGNPSGSCGGFKKGTCEGNKHALSIIEKECVGKDKCSVDVSENTFGSSNCGNIVKRLAVEVVCQ